MFFSSRITIFSNFKHSLSKIKNHADGIKRQAYVIVENGVIRFNNWQLRKKTSFHLNMVKEFVTRKANEKDTLGPMVRPS